MKQTVTASQFEKSIGEIMKSVRARGECYVVSSRGREPVAVVPLHVLESYERSRQCAADIMEKVAAGSGLTSEEAEQVAKDEVAAARKERRAQRKPGKQPKT